MYLSDTACLSHSVVFLYFQNIISLIINSISLIMKYVFLVIITRVAPTRFQTPIIAASTRLILLQQQHLYSSSSKIRSETRIESQKTPLLPIWCTTQIWCTTRFFPFWKTYVSFCTWTGTRLVLFSFWIFSVGQCVSNSSQMSHKYALQDWWNLTTRELFEILQNTDQANTIHITLSKG